MKEKKYKYNRPRLTSYQKAILDSPAHCTVSVASVKSGKTNSHIIWLFEQALEGEPNQNFWFVAPVYSLAKIAFERMRNQVSDPNFFKANISKLRLTLTNGTHIWFKSADKPNSLYSEDVCAVVFDEFTRANEEAWIALNSTLEITQAKAKFIGNYNIKQGWFTLLINKAKEYSKENKNKNLKKLEYEYFKVNAYDAVREGVLTLEEVEEAKRDLPKETFTELYLAESID